MYNLVCKKYIKGFSIAEVCIVCSILAVVLVPVFTLMSRGNSGTVRNKYEIIAHEYATNYLSYFSLLPFDDEILAASDEKPIPEIKIPYDGNDTIALNDIDEGFNKIATVTFSIINFDKTPSWNYNYKLVTIYINWQQSGEPKRNLTMSGIITE